MSKLERWAGVVLAVVAVAGTVLTGLLFPGIPVAVLIGGAAVQLAASALLGRSRSPLPVVLSCATVAALLLALPTPWRPAAAGGVVVWIPIALSAATAELSTRARQPIEMVIGAVALAGYPVAMFVRSPSLASLANGLAPILGGICVALLLRLRQARRDQANALAARRAGELQAARAAERAVMAADMHDLLSDGLTRIVLQTRILIAAEADDGCRDRARRIEHTATTTLTAMRERLKLINSDSETAESPRYIEVSVPARPPDLIAVVDEAERLGEDVELELDGFTGSRPVSRPVWECVVRIVQEGLLNARKHAPGAPVSATVRIAEGRCSVAVSNPPTASRPADGDPVFSGTGTGLRGLGHRVRLLGGEFAVTREDGFAIRAALPVTGSDASPAVRS